MAKKKIEKENYYSELQEQAVIDFLNTENPNEREEIYNEYLRKPINKMIESIIRTYRLYRKSFEFEDLHQDTLSFLITKFHNFKPEKGKKSFSYFGTICRHYLFGEMVKAYKSHTKIIDYDDVQQELMEREDMIYYTDKTSINLDELINKTIKKIENSIYEDNLNDNELKVAVSLVHILENWENLFGDADGGTKFNKNLILLYLRNMTGLTTKEIRTSMKCFKIVYFDLKEEMLN